MIAARVIRRIARERGLALDIVEKDYLLGWMLFCISRTSLSDSLAFKGGSALSKVYFPLDWRLSEDLDFTLLTDEDMPSVAEKLAEEIPAIGEEMIPEVGLRFPRAPFANPGFVRGRLQYIGPVSPNNVKIEITREEYVGTTKKTEVPPLVRGLSRIPRPRILPGDDPRREDQITTGKGKGEGLV